jgi:hypothetical protein
VKGPAAATPEAPPAVAAPLAAFRAGGEPLSPAARAYFEPRFGRDLSAVRLHAGAEAAAAARAVGARAFTVGSDVAFGAGEYRPQTAAGTRLLAHELAHAVQPDAGRWLRRSPLSDSVAAAFAVDPTIEALLARLGQADVQAAQADTDVDAAVARLLSGRTDDLWVAERVRRGKLGESKGAAPRPIEAFFIRGATDKRALVIAGVHGTERQGIEVARMLIADLQTAQPHFTVIVVPTLFPDNAASGTFGRRHGTTETNRNFPDPSKDLAAAKAAGGDAVDALGAKILHENLLLMELMERFRPERIISIHGTWKPVQAGVFFDPRELRSDEVAEAERIADEAYSRRPARVEHTSEGEEAARREMRDKVLARELAQRRQQAIDTDAALSLAAAKQIDTATASITGREGRKLTGDKAKHPSVAGNVGSSGALDNPTYPGAVSTGVSLGRYAPPRGMSVFTIEPPVNRNTGDYPSADKDPGVSAAHRKTELKSYADAIRTVLLGEP